MSGAGKFGNLRLRCLIISFNCFVAVDLCGSVKFGACLASAYSSSAVESFGCRKSFCEWNCFSPGLDRQCRR